MKLRCLIVMPRVAAKNEAYNFPLGIAYISAVMKKAGFDCYTLNLNHIDGAVADIVKKSVLDNNINVVMTGGLSIQYSNIKNIVDCVFRNFPEIKIIVGGGLITADPYVAMEALEYADIGIIGEGEITSVELCEKLENFEKKGGGCATFLASSLKTATNG